VIPGAEATVLRSEADGVEADGVVVEGPTGRCTVPTEVARLTYVIPV
jgi:hypothetical protein